MRYLAALPLDDDADVPDPVEFVLNDDLAAAAATVVIEAELAAAEARREATRTDSLGGTRHSDGAGSGEDETSRAVVSSMSASATAELPFLSRPLSTPRRRGLPATTCYTI